MNREDDINNLIMGVIAIEPSSYCDHEDDNINYYCPFCYKDRNCDEIEIITMKDIKHELDCVYLIALDLASKH